MKTTSVVLLIILLTLSALFISCAPNNGLIRANPNTGVSEAQFDAVIQSLQKLNQKLDAMETRLVALERKTGSTYSPLGNDLESRVSKLEERLGREGYSPFAMNYESQIRDLERRISKLESGQSTWRPGF